MKETTDRRILLWLIAIRLEKLRADEIDKSSFLLPGVASNAPGERNNHMKIPYPTNYFDPTPTEEHAQCTECGDWFISDEINDVEQVYCLVYGYIWQGVCIKCEENGPDKDSTV